MKEITPELAQKRKDKAIDKLRSFLKKEEYPPYDITLKKFERRGIIVVEATTQYLIFKMERHTPLDPYYEPGSHNAMSNFITTLQTYKFIFKDKDIIKIDSKITDLDFSVTSYVDMYIGNVYYAIGYNKNKKHFYIKLNNIFEIKLDKLSKMYSEAEKIAIDRGKSAYEEIMAIFENEMSESEKEYFDRNVLPTQDEIIACFKDELIKDIDVTIARYAEHYEKIEHE